MSQVKPGHDPIVGIVRVRPPLHSHDNKTCLLNAEDDVEVAMVDHQTGDKKRFTFDYVARAHTTQAEIFDRVGVPIVDQALKGYNGSIFAYGQTSAGKSYTMLGPAESQHDLQSEVRGVIPRVLEYLFRTIKHQETTTSKTFMCKCSFLEIYNDQIFDLLEPASQNLQLRNDIKRGVFVENLREYLIENTTEALDVLSRGLETRHVGATSMNRDSSRSHAVFTVVLQSKEVRNNLPVVREARINLVDLAGSERQKLSQTTGAVLKEAAKINQSLTTFGKVIMALVDIAQGRERHVPYRDSPLTFLLKDSLGGNTKTYIIANVSPEAAHYGETLSTLNYVYRAKMIRNKAEINECAEASVEQLQAEIRRLQRELEMAAGGGGGGEAGVGGEAGAGAGHVPAGRAREIEAALVLATRDMRRAVEERDDQSARAAALEACVAQYETALQRTQLQCKMQTKMRDALLKKTVGESDILDALRHENTALHAAVTNHPDVLRLSGENLALKAEIKQLRAQYPTAEADNAVVADLRQLVAKLSKHLNENIGGNSPPDDRTAKVRVSDAHAELAHVRERQQQAAVVKELQAALAETQQALKAKSDALDKLTLEAQADAQASTHQAREAAARAGLEAEVAGLKAQLEEAAAASIALEDEAAALKASMQDAREGEAAACKELRDREQQVYALEGEAGRARDETERLQAELQSIQTDLEARVAENGFAAAQLAEAEDALAAANQRVAELEAAVQALQEKVAVETDLAADLRAQLDSRGDAEARLGDAMKLNAQLGEAIDDLNAAVAALKRDLVGAQQATEAERGKAAKAQAEAENAQRVVREYAQLVQAARAEAGEAATHLTTVRQELEDTRKTISFLEGQRHSLQESLAQAEAERADLVAASAAELQGKDDDLVRLRSTMAEAAAERDRLSAELAAAQETYAQAADASGVRIAGLEAELEQARAHASSTATQLAAKEQQVQSLRAELERDSSNLSAQTTALRELRVKYEQQKEQMSALAARCEEATDMLRMKSEECAAVCLDAKAAVQQRNEQVAAIQAQMQVACAAADERHAALHAQLMAAEQARADANKKLDETLARLERLGAETDRLQADKDELAGQLQRLVFKVEIAQQDNEEMSDKINKLLGENARLFEENEKYWKEFDRVMEERRRAVEDIKQKEAEMQTLRDENERLGGHRNPLQRIHHLQAVKQERNDLKLAKDALEIENERLRTLCEKAGIEVPAPAPRAALAPAAPAVNRSGSGSGSGRPAAKQLGPSALSKVPGPGAKAKPEPKENIPS